MTWVAASVGRASAASVSKATPCQRMSSRLQPVTQWKSETSSACGSARKSSQRRRSGSSTSPSTRSSQRSVEITGWSAQSSTGQVESTFWRGGTCGMPWRFLGPLPCGAASAWDGVARMASPKRCRSCTRPSSILFSMSVTEEV